MNAHGGKNCYPIELNLNWSHGFPTANPSRTPEMTYRDPTWAVPPMGLEDSEGSYHSPRTPDAGVLLEAQLVKTIPHLGAGESVCRGVGGSGVLSLAQLTRSKAPTNIQIYLFVVIKSC